MTPHASSNIASPPPPPARVTLAGARGCLRPSGAFWWPRERLLCVGDLHLGRARRLARTGGALLPPYACGDTLDRLAGEIAALAPRVVVCLGDSFDDHAAAEDPGEEIAARLEQMAAGRDWIWIAGNHDPRPVAQPGRWMTALAQGPLDFRHIADPRGPAPGRGEVSGHFHPKACVTRRGRRVSRPCFLADTRRLILPAFGTFTGGLDAGDRAFDRLLERGATAHLLGDQVVSLPRAALG